jgi:hypothetical protein
MKQNYTKTHLSSLLKVSNSFRLLLMIVVVSLFGNVTSAQTVTSTAAGGDWSVTSTWVGGVVPADGSNVVIATTGTNKVFLSKNEICANLTINTGAILDIIDKKLEVNGNILLNGTCKSTEKPSAAGKIDWKASGGTLDGVGTFDNIAKLDISDIKGSDAKTILASANITFAGANQNIDLVKQITLTNNGIVTIAGLGITDKNSSVWVNIGTLNYAGTEGLMDNKTSTLTASALGNIVNYNGVAQIVKATTYFNLTLSGTNIKTFASTTIVSNTLSIASGVKANLNDKTDHTACSLVLNGVSQIAGTWGATSSGATSKSNTFFDSIKAGIVTVASNSPASVSISASANPVCSGTSVTFTATPTNGGTTPTYQWKLNGTIVGTNSATYANATLANGDKVSCVMTSNASCGAGSLATSNVVTMTVNALPTITGTLNVCVGSTTTLTGSVTAAATTPWKSASTGVATVNASGVVTGVSAGTSVITYTNSNGCTITATVTVNILPTAYAMTGSGGNICSSSAGSAIGLVNSDIGVSYQLLRGITSLGSAIAGTGSALSFGNFNVTGVYTVKATRTDTGCATTMNGSVNINSWATPPVPTATVADVSCSTDTTGAITITNSPLSPASLTFARADNDYVDFGKPLLSGLREFSAEAWIKFNPANYANRMSLFGQNDVVEFGFEGSNLRCWTAGGGTVDYPLSSYPTDNAWHHIAVVGNGKNLMFYIDGVQVANTAKTTSNYGSSTDNTRIGWGVMDASGGGFTGEVFKLGFWNKALTPEEITNMASGFVVYDASQTGLLAGYNFNEGAGTTLSSVGSVVATGTFKNSPTWTDPYTYSWTKTASSFSSNAINLTGLTPGTYNLTTSLKGCTQSGSWTVKAAAAPPSTPVVLPITPTCSSTLVINWNAAANATSYGIQLSEFDTFSSHVTPTAGAILDGRGDKGNVTSYSVTGLTPGKTYYYKIWAYNTCGFSTSIMHTATTGKGDATWSTSGWSVTPTNLHRIVFAADYPAATVAGNLDGCSCEVKPGVKVTIPSGKTLSLINELTVNTATGATLTFEDTASLWQENDASVNIGAIVYKRKSSIMKDLDYTYWSSPVEDQNINDLSPNTQWDKFYYYADGWKPAYNTAKTATMTTGRGYIIRRPKVGSVDNGVVVSSLPYAQAVQFEGKPYNGDKITFTVDAKLNRENLIGNPYPSALDANAFLLANKDVIDGTIYFWTHNTAIQLAGNITNGSAGSGANAYTSDDYASYNSLGGVSAKSAQGHPANPGDPDNGLKPSGKIAAGQSFMALTKKSSGTVVFNNAMRVKASNTQFFKQTKNAKTTASDRQRVWLNLTNAQGAFKQTLIGYIKGATNGYEDLFDGINKNGNGFVDLYSINEGNNFVIQGRALPFDPTDVVPLGYSSKIEGTFAISIDEVDGDLSNQAIFIEDKHTQTIHDLKSGAYSFTTQKGTFNERFVLRYTDKTLGSGDFETTDNAVVVTVKNKQLKIHSAVEAIDKVLVYDLSGRQLYKKERLNSTEVTVQYLTSGTQALVVKVVLENGNIVTKKVIY